jgi:hypothetical protein
VFRSVLSGCLARRGDGTGTSSHASLCRQTGITLTQVVTSQYSEPSQYLFGTLALATFSSNVKNPNLQISLQPFQVMGSMRQPRVIRLEPCSRKTRTVHAGGLNFIILSENQDFMPT